MSFIECIQLILSCIFQIALFSLIPFIWWKLTKVNERFLKWLGFKKPNLEGSVYMIVICVIIGLFINIIDYIVLPNMSAISESGNITSSQYKGMGAHAILPVFIQCLFQNGISEELLFRGFFSKRFISKFGFKVGNLIQAFLFGITHVIPMIIMGIDIGLFGLILVFISTTGSALVLTYINEKVFNGSIIPSIIVHAIGNFVFMMVIAFS